MARAMPTEEKAALKAQVRTAVERMLLAGIEPTDWRLRRAFPTRGRFTLAFLRDELAEEGLIDWEPAAPKEEQGYLPDERELRIRAFRVRYGLLLPEEMSSCP